MKNYIYALLLCCVAVSIIALVSCSDDKGVNNNEISQAQYLQMQTMTDETVVPMATSLVNSAMGRLDGVSAGDYGIGKAALHESDSVMVLFHPLTGWWEAYFSTENSEGEDPHYAVQLLDSIQFKSVTGNNQFVPNDSTDYMHDIPRASIMVESDSLNSAITVMAHNDMVYADLQSDAANIDGPMNLQIAMEIDTLGKHIAGLVNVTLETDDLEIPIPVEDEEVCPLSGVITYTLVENITSQFVGDEVTNTTWSIRVTIVDPQTYLIKISAGNIEFDEYQLDPQHVCANSIVSGAVGKAISLIRSH